MQIIVVVHYRRGSQTDYATHVFSGTTLEAVLRTLPKSIEIQGFKITEITISISH